MAFPSNPSHLAPALVNGVNYVYDSTTVSWSPQSSTNTLTIGSLDTFSVSGNASVLGTFGIGTASPTQALSVNGSIGGTILYDYNDTGYYVDPNVTSNMYTAIFRNTAYSYGWWRSYNATGWYNETYGGGVWMTDSTYVRVYNGKNFLVESAAHMRIGTGEANEKSLHFHNDARYLYFFQQSVAGGSNFGLWDATGSFTRWLSDTSGNFYNYVSIRAPIFYDTDNTGYYFDGNNTSRLYGINLNILTGSQQNYSVANSSNTVLATPSGVNSTSAFIHFTGGTSIAPYSMYRSYGDWSAPYGIGWTNGGESSGIFQRFASNSSSFGDLIYYIGNDGVGAHSFRAAGWESTTYYSAGSNQYNTELLRIQVDGSVIAGTRFYTPIMYDANDSAYYVDPTGTSVLNVLSTTGLYYTRTNDAAFNAANDTTLSIRGNASYPATMSFHRTGVYAINVGLDTDNYFSIGGWSASTIKHKFAMDGNYWTSLWSDWLTNQWRSNIFYDNNDTYYYCDPNSTSRLWDVNVPNRLSIGTTVGAYAGKFNVYNGASTAATFVGGWGSYGAVVQLITDGAGAQDGPRLWYHKGGAKYWSAGIEPYGSNGYGIWEDGSGLGWGTERFRIDPGGNVVSYVSHYSPIYYDYNDSGYYCDPNSRSSFYSAKFWGNEVIIRGGSPTVFFQDVDHNSAMIHNNSHLLYILRGATDSTTWATVGPSYWWPCYWDLTNNNCVMGGYFSNAYDIVAWASDRRLKENIVEITNAIDKIKQIRGVTFDWNDTADDAGFRPVERYNNVGVIAQEIQAVLPQAVKPAPFDKWVPDPGEHYSDEVLTANRETSRTGEDYLTVQMEKIIPLLIQAIKEQQTQIENLQSRLDQINP